MESVFMATPDEIAEAICNPSTRLLWDLSFKESNDQKVVNKF